VGLFICPRLGFDDGNAAKGIPSTRFDMRATWIATVTAAMLYGCVTPISPTPPGGPDFRAAYNDGCAAGYGYAGSPFHSNRGTQPEGQISPDSRAGWIEGFSQCSRSYDRIQQVIHAFFGSP